jgi:acid phosphatase
VIVVEENHSYTQTITQPYLQSLARIGANFTNAHGITHPSQPNYLALWSGSTHGITSDACPVNLGSTPSLGSQVGATIYSESLPSAGYLGCASGAYARKHNPLADFTATRNSAHDKPFSAFPTTYADLPPVSMVVPNLHDDMHDGSVAAGDTWLKNHLSGYATWAMTHNSVLIVTFDEDNGTSTNGILTVIVGQHVAPGNYSTRITHYNVLTTIEKAYGVPALSSASPITGVWK